MHCVIALIGTKLEINGKIHLNSQKRPDVLADPS